MVALPGAARQLSTDPDIVRRIHAELEEHLTVLASSEVESMRSTLVVSHTPSGDVVAKLSSLPFNYQLQVRNDTGSAYEATVIIGQDFVKK